MVVDPLLTVHEIATAFALPAAIAQGIVDAVADPASPVFGAVIIADFCSALATAFDGDFFG